MLRPAQQWLRLDDSGHHRGPQRRAATQRYPVHHLHLAGIPRQPASQHDLAVGHRHTHAGRPIGCRLDHLQAGTDRHTGADRRRSRPLPDWLRNAELRAGVSGTLRRGKTSCSGVPADRERDHLWREPEPQQTPTGQPGYGARDRRTRPASSARRKPHHRARRTQQTLNGRG
jgi:hypothetical protein